MHACMHVCVCICVCACVCVCMFECMCVRSCISRAHLDTAALEVPIVEVFDCIISIALLGEGHESCVCVCVCACV
jgi:hypothetical protein